ncbi:neuromodulin [Orussus abietinus]|uniref:neuromodulin n=1 Tax=Orussus abietinus TaxID=222816 RepID=UPI0006260FAB|nr:neuromodulin [Orussus abietinus]XP_012283760.1 neuromodulin [Orussus abietinus]
MGARQSKRSVDITTTPKKEGVPAEGVGDAAPGDGKLERIEETDAKPTSNGIGPHTDAEEKDKDKDETAEKDKEKVPEDGKADEPKQEATAETPENAEVTTPTEAAPATVTSPETKEAKKKDKLKKKWSLRSISFSKKDKTKPAREETPKNGDVTKEEPLPEGGEEAETAAAIAGSPTEEKSAVSSPTGAESGPGGATAAEAKDEKSAAAPAEEKKEEPTPSALPTPVPVEEKKEDNEKVEAAPADKLESKPEVKAPVENAVAKEVSTTESVDEAPTSPPPAVPVEAPVAPAPASAPAITEDVASVTKAIEEIDINEKAVAAAVNESIESATTNEIVAETRHQNILNE